MEIVSVFDNDEDHVDHTIFFKGTVDMQYCGYDDQPDDWPEGSWISNLIPDNGIYQLHADGRMFKVGEAFIPDPDVIENRFQFEEQELLWQIPHTTQ